MSSNVPIIGPQAKGDLVHEFREGKLNLKARGYPKEETKAFVSQFFEKIKEKVVAQVDDKTLLVKVPSGSGENKVTYYFAQELARSTGAQILPDGLISKLHKGEAKKNLSLEQRTQDPIRYRIEAPEEVRSHARKAEKVIIIDDLIGSGESSIRLKQSLERANVKIHALANLVTVEKYYPTPGDFERVHRKVNTLAKLVMSDSVKFKQDLKDAFQGYTRQKLNRLEREIRNEERAVKAFKIVSKAAKIERGFNKGKGNDLSL